MTTRAIVIEQRLRSLWIAVVIAITMVVFLVAITVAANAANGNSVSVLVAAIDVVVLLLLFVPFLLVLRVVVRVVETSEGRALEVVYGRSGIVRQCFGPERIIDATTRTVSFRQTGGWGYRGSLRLFKWAALATRSGDALELKLLGGRRFIVTVDEPQDFVTALTR